MMVDNKRNVVYILGAGCSKEDGAPLINEFFDKAFNDAMCSAGKFVPCFERVKSFRNEYLPNSNVEELLSYIDLELTLKTRSDVFRQNNVNLEDIRYDLIAIIYETIRVCIKSGQSANYRHFLSNQVGSVKEKLIPILISFNWDTSLDNTLLLSKGPPGQQINYAAPFQMIHEDGSKLEYSVGGEKLLKLHGSLNWYQCTSDDNCINKYYFVQGDHSGIRISKDKLCRCPSCNSPISPVIIPPTFQKFPARNLMSESDKINQLISTIWSEAFKAIENAEKIVIVGYSFPEDDVHFRLFLKSALISNFGKSKSHQVSIDVVNYKRSLDEKLEFEKHYMKMIDIPGRDIRPNFHYLKFSEFAKSKYDKDLVLRY